MRRQEVERGTPLATGCSDEHHRAPDLALASGVAHSPPLEDDQPGRNCLPVQVDSWIRRGPTTGVVGRDRSRRLLRERPLHRLTRHAGALLSRRAPAVSLETSRRALLRVASLLATAGARQTLRPRRDPSRRTEPSGAGGVGDRRLHRARPSRRFHRSVAALLR